MVYRIHDLYLQSEIAFPALPQVVSPPRIDIDLSLAPRWPAPDDDPGRVLIAESAWRLAGRPARSIYRAQSGYVMRAANAGDFVVSSDARSIVFHPMPGASRDEAWAFVLGPVLAHCCHLRGRQVLHAAAVVVDGRALVLLGDAGSGKSSLAAAFVAARYLLLTDDVLVLEERGPEFHALPGYPVLRLRSDAISRFIGTPEEFRPAPPDVDKRWVPVWHAFSASPTALAAIYVLSADVPCGVQPESVRHGDIVLALLANTFGGTLLDPAMRARQFEAYCRLAAEVPVRTMSFHHERPCVEEVRAAILDDFARVAAARSVSE